MMEARRTAVAALDPARIEACRDTLRSNCIGTALYLVGGQEEDRFLDTFVAHESHLVGMLRIDSPVENCLVSWERAINAIGMYDNGKLLGYYESRAGHVLLNKIDHLGIVASVEPLLVTSRQGSCGYFIEMQPFDEAGRTFEGCSVSFYVPRWQIVEAEALAPLTLPLAHAVFSNPGRKEGGVRRVS